MRSTVIICTALSIAVGTSAIQIERLQAHTTTNVARAANAVPALPVASLVTEMTGKVPKPKSRQAILRRQYESASTKGAVLAGSSNDFQYLVNMTVGGQTFKVIVDTGSSETWLVEKGFECFNLTSYPESPSTCNFGSEGFDPEKSTTFEALPNHNVNFSYVDGEFLTGSVGFDTITIGNLTVESQEFGLINKAAWNGDGVNSGLLGLAFGKPGSVYTGTDPQNDSSNNSVYYDSFFFIAVKEKQVSQPIFSIALNRGSFANQVNSTYDSPLGYLAFGGVAPVPVTSTVAAVPVQRYQVSYAPNETKYLLYTIEVDDYVFPGSTELSTNKTAIIDSGTTLNYLPNSVAKAFNAKFVPPATYHEESNLYYVDCNAEVPPFAVKIGGKNFAIDGRDNILPWGTDDEGKQLCISGTQNGDQFRGNWVGGSLFLLGDVFLHNVVATFDVVNKTIYFSERVSY